LSLFFLYALYLSLFCAGQIFMGFQWDALLLESGFLALLLSVATKPGIWLLRWLLFRFMFLSGSVKLLSGDPTWANLSAALLLFSDRAATDPAGLVRPSPAAGCTHSVNGGDLCH
jgi:lipase maturation factor 1